MKILYNAKIYTMDPKQPTATAIAVEGERILAVGSDDQILNLAQPQSVKQNMDGKTIIPGLTDAHMHLEMYALGLQNVNAETISKQECISRVAEKARTTPSGEWILGYGWNQNVWSEGYGSTEDLDSVAPNHPVYLSSKSGHAGWANSKALATANITSQTPNPEGGIILKNPAGNPNGILLETAMLLVERIIPPPSEKHLCKAIENAQSTLWKYGLTGIHDYDRSNCLNALQILHLDGKLNLRIVKNIPLENMQQAISVGLRSGFGDDYIRIGSIKVFSDGALGPQTAAMITPYENSKTTGILLIDTEQLVEYGCEAVRHGLSLAVHAIGDQANHVVIEAYSQLRDYEKQNNLKHPRHRIEHVQLLSNQDLKRLAKYNIIASMQPIHATSDMIIADRHWGKRCQNAYAFQTLLNNGTKLAFGSDAPVESPDPFLGIHAAVTRRRTDGSPSEVGWHPEQKVTLQQALEGYTIGPAYASGREDWLGRLSPGFLADLVVLEADLFAIAPQDLHLIKPCATMVGSKWVWVS